eukprot:jgi/Botrbrau1/6405/Bobra.49_1s0022.1
MVRTVQLDDALQKNFDTLLQNRSREEVGLVVGTLGGSVRDAILATIPTPDVEGERSFTVKAKAAAGGKSKGKDNRSTQAPQYDVTLKGDSVLEQALQVQSMLPGGLDIQGVYAFCPDAAFQSVLGQFSQLLQQMSAAHIFRQSSGKDPAPIMLTMCSVTGKLVLKELDRQSLRPCELAVSPVLPNLRQIKCQYHISCFVNVSGQPGLEALKKVLHTEGIKAKRGWVFVQGRIYPDSTPVGDVLGQSSTANDAQVSLRVAACTSAGGKDEASGDVAGRLAIDGWISARAIAHKRESWGNLVSKLKDDIVRSLAARVSVLESGIDATDDAPHHLSAPLGSSPQTWPMPKRVFMPLEESIQVCDYIESGGDIGEVLESAAQLLSMPTPELSQVELCEEDPHVPSTARFWQVGQVQQLPSCKAIDRGHGHARSPEGTSAWLMLIVAITIALLGVLVGILRLTS